MNRVQRTALLAFFLLLLMAAAGWWLGGKQAQPADAKPSAVLLDPGALETVRLLPPEQRQRYVGKNRFAAPPVDNPLDPRGGRIAGGSLPKPGPINPGAVPGVAPANASYRTIRIHQNESLSVIAKRELGSGSSAAWRSIMQWNGIEDERSIKVGQQLRIYDGLYDANAKVQASPKPVVPTDGNAALAGMRYHTVKSGEILGRISKKYYNTTQEVPRILEANGLTNPHGIKVGQVLNIPPLN